MRATSERKYGARWALALTAVAALGASMLTAPAQAAVTGSRIILVSPNDNIVLIEGLNDSTEYTVTVTRGGTPIGGVTATPAAFGVAGALEINHAAGPTLCWGAPASPDIQPGDVVSLTDSGGTFTDTVPVRNVTMAPAGAVPAGTNAFTVSGTVDPAFVANLEVFIRLQVGAAATDWRATATTANQANNIVVDGAGNWTATFTQEDGGAPVDAEVLEAAASPRVLDASVAFNANEITSVGPDAGDPHPAECPPVATHSLGRVTPQVLNAANAGVDLTASGATANSTAVEVSLSDGTNSVGPIPATLAGTGAAQTWSVTVPGAQLAGLNGTISVTATHTPDLGVPQQNTKTVLRDLVAPGAPTVSPNGGAISGLRSVFITPSGGEAVELRYTVGNGSQPAPTPTSGIPFTGPFGVGAGQTVKAIAVDAADNPSAVTTAAFTQAAAPPPVVTPPGGGSSAIIPLAPRIGEAKSGRPGGNDTATAKWRAPRANGAVLSGYEVRALKLRPGRSAKVRPAVVVDDSTAKRLRMSLPAGKYKFQVRAVSTAGKSPWSERSATVRSR